MSKELLFVYGTLRGNHPLMEGAKSLGEAGVSGKLYNLGWFPGVKLGGPTLVNGEVFELPEGRISRLDLYEGVPNLYKRVRTQTSIYCGAVWIYEFNGPVREEQLIPSGDWLKREESQPELLTIRLQMEGNDSFGG